MCICISEGSHPKTELSAMVEGTRVHVLILSCARWGPAFDSECGISRLGLSQILCYVGGTPRSTGKRDFARTIDPEILRFCILSM